MPEAKISEAELAEFQRLKAAEAQRQVDEPIIQEKIEAGLTREQAVQVIAFQRKADEIEAKKAKTAEAATEKKPAK